MMSKKQWFVVLCIFILYLLLGAAIFYIIESKEENEKLEQEKAKKFRVIDFIDQLFRDIQNPILRKQFERSLEDYCEKPFKKNVDDPIHVWDFYHSLFFVITVVSTIGYGNLAPTTMFTRIFMIFYGLIGIPMNGIVMVTLGSYFGRSFTKLYQRWKTSKLQYDNTKLGLISQIILYLVPGFTFFIFLPSAFMVLFENWQFDVAVYYCFVTLTTIGFGDIVAGVDNVNEFRNVPYWMYKTFLLVWVIGGLGYVLMILGFITQALQSKKVQAIEQIIKNNIKKTPVRIRQELRGILQEFLFLKVKREYKDFDYIPTRIERSQSCPDLNIYRNKNSPTTARKRALSECPHTLILKPMTSVEAISTESNDLSQRSDLLMRVVDALSILEDQDDLSKIGYDGFTDSEILSSEKYGSKWSITSQVTPIIKSPRRRAISDIRTPTIQTRPDNTYQTYLTRQRTFSDTNKPQNLLTRIKNKLTNTKDEKAMIDVENNRRASMFTTNEDRYLRQTNRGRASLLSIQQQEQVLEQTSIADFIRALSVIADPVKSEPRRKLGTASLTPPKTPQVRTRRLAIRPNSHMRRTSLVPDSNVVANERRRFSLRPVDENLLAPPTYAPPTRKFSRSGANIPSISISPVQRQVNKNKENE